LFSPIFSFSLSLPPLSRKSKQHHSTRERRHGNPGEHHLPGGGSSGGGKRLRAERGTPSKKARYECASIFGSDDDDKGDAPIAHTKSTTRAAGYTGWLVPEKQDERVLPRVDPASINAKDFYARFVQERRPCILPGHLSGSRDGWKATELWTDAYLTSKSGDKTIRVEKRASVKEGFGKGKEISMRFGDFLCRISKENDQSLYLTTQDLDTDKAGRPALMAPPVSDLTEDFPLQPLQLTGNLTPFNMNIWMGNSKNGSSSGLHHDFHDNLYILLRGRKRFRLYSPSCARFMYTRGTIDRVHPNGLINYKERPPTRMDGADPMCMQAIDASDELQDAEAELGQAQNALRELEVQSVKGQRLEDANVRVSKAEARVDTALESVLEAEMDDDDGMQDSDDNAGSQDDSDNEINTAKSVPNPNNITEGEPLNFCQVNPDIPLQELKAKFPKFLHNSVRPLLADVRAGEMLFLPAGWFHEVTSFSDSHGKTSKGGDDAREGTSEGSLEGGVHMAFNYWFHPPDTQEGTFEQPYSDTFWSKDWDKRQVQADPSNGRADEH
jgi:hypothetical protein